MSSDLDNKNIIKNIKDNINNIEINIQLNEINKDVSNSINQLNNKIETINNRQNNNRQNNNNINKIRNIYVDPKDLLKPIGILDPDGLELNPLTGEQYENLYTAEEDGGKTYKDWSEMWKKFPMYEKREEAIKVLHENQVVLIVSGTGSGKTVLTPKFLLHTLNYQGKIAVTNPKTKPSLSNAQFAAKLLDVRFGEEVGVHYRNNKKTSSNTKLTFCTDGLIVAKLKGDPLLSEYDAVIIDEAHERNVRIDLLLLLLKDLLKKRPNFKLIIMSATINTKLFSDYFPKPEFKFGFLDAGKVPNHPIGEFYLEKPINQFNDNGILMNDRYIETAVDRVIKILRETENGDILVFFTSGGDSNKGCQLLHEKLGRINKELDKNIYCDTLKASTNEDLAKIYQNAEKYKTLPSGPYTRKVIFSTDVAESSMTFPGTDFIVDSGLSLISRYYPKSDITALEKRYISKASHEQRRGRTGRTAPGTCYNLFTADEFKGMEDYTKPPILIENISDEILGFISRKDLVSHINIPFKYSKKSQKGGFNQDTNNYQALPLSDYLQKFIEAPKEDTIKTLLTRLFALDALRFEDDSKKAVVTDIGLGMAEFSVKPELARTLIAGYNYKCRDEVCIIAAMMEILGNRMEMLFESPRLKGTKEEINKLKKEEKKAIHKWKNKYGDHIALLRIYKEYAKHKYDKIDRRTGRIISEKVGDAKEWTKTNYLKEKILSRVKYTSKQYQRIYGRLIGISRNSQNSTNSTNNTTRSYNTLFNIKEPVISETIELNVINAFIQGYYVNLIKHSGGKYTTCFPEIKTYARPDRSSYMSLTKQKPQYGIYTIINSIAANEYFTMVSSIPPLIIKEIKDNKLRKIMLRDCLDKKEEKKSNKKSNKKSKKKKWKKSRKRSKKRSR